MDVFSSEALHSPLALALGIYFVLSATADANIVQEAARRPPSEDSYGLQSLTHEPMFVDEPMCILLNPRTASTSSSEDEQDEQDEQDDQFWVTRGRKRYLNTLRPPTLFDRRAVNFFVDDEDAGSWRGRGKKGTLEHVLDSDPFWVNHGKKAVVSSALDKDPFWVNRRKRSDLSSALEDNPFLVNRERRNEKRNEIEDMLAQEPYWANRGKKRNLSSGLNNGDQFWVNRGKKNDFQSALNSGDPFWVNRGKKNDFQSSFNNGDPFWVNRGKKSELQSALNSGDQFWVNRGKKSELQSALNSRDQFWVNRRKKSELQSVLNSGDQFWVNRGKKSELQSILNNGDQFWVNRGKKSELQSALNNGDQFWVNRGKKSELQSTLNNGDQFWVNRGKKSELQSALNSRDQFWVNRGKKSELQSALNIGDQFWVNRGKKSELPSAFNSGHTFWINRGKISELQSALNSGDQFWVNRGKRSVLQSALNSGDQFWVNRGKKSDLKSVLNSQDQFGNRGKKSEVQSVLNNRIPFWVNRGKKNELQSLLGRSGDQFWVNRGKKSEFGSLLGGGGDKVSVNRDKKKVIANEKEIQVNRLETNDGFNSEDSNIQSKSDSLILNTYLSPARGPLFWSDSQWNGRFKKDPFTTILKPDAFFVNRGKKADRSESSLEKPKLESDTNETQSRKKTDERTKRQVMWEKDARPLTSQFKNAYWSTRGKKTNEGSETLDPFWVTRGKRPEMHRRKRRDVGKTGAESATKPSLSQDLRDRAVSPSQRVSRRKRTAKSPEMDRSSYDTDYPSKKDSNVNSLLLWWKDKSPLGEFQDSIVDDDTMEAGSPMMRLRENMPKQDPFWVNRGKKDVDVHVDDFPEKEGIVLDKRGDDGEVAMDGVIDLATLARPEETFWVAFG